MTENFLIYPFESLNGVCGSQDNRLSMPTPFDCIKVILGKEDQYVGWTGNEHHWTMRYVWNRFIPVMMDKLEIDFNPEQYQEI